MKKKKCGNPCEPAKVVRVTGEQALTLRCEGSCEKIIFVTTSYGSLIANNYYLCNSEGFIKLSLPE